MAKNATCAVFGKPIEANVGRFVDVHNGTKVHVHFGCKK